MPKTTAAPNDAAPKNDAAQPREPWTFAQRFHEPDFHAPELALRPLDQVAAKQLLWEGRAHAPRGSVTIIAGEHGAGKSLLALDWAALISTGYPAFWLSAGEEALSIAAAEREGGPGAPARQHNGGPGKPQGGPGAPARQREITPDGRGRPDLHNSGRGRPDLHESDQGKLGDIVPSNAVIAHAGDMTLDVLRRRIDAAGGSPERIASLALSRPDKELKFTFDLIRGRVLALACAFRGAPDVRLLVIDNLEAFAGNLHEPPSPALLGFLLASLAELASQADIAIVALVPLPRSGGQAAARKLDALADAAPVVYLAASDPDRPGRKLLLPVKNILAPPAPAKAFEIVAGRVVWSHDPVEASADEFIAPLSQRLAARHERESAARWLLSALADGPVLSRELFRQARDCGISTKTLRRAAQSLGLSPRKTSFDGPWQWQLCEAATSNSAARETGEPQASASGSY
ncbi:MAG TPA: AAA family ATPase, partial [Pirellulales bacterium]|nr:AAA family ATPase [Pirellulales bacterium]